MAQACAPLSDGTCAPAPPPPPPPPDSYPRIDHHLAGDPTRQQPVLANRHPRLGTLRPIGPRRTATTTRRTRTRTTSSSMTGTRRRQHPSLRPRKRLPSLRGYRRCLSMLRQDRPRGDPPLLPLAPPRPAGGRLHLLPHRAGVTTTAREVSSRLRKIEIAIATETGTGGDLIRDGNAAAADGPEPAPARTVQQVQTPLPSVNATRWPGDHHHHHRHRGAGNRPFREGTGGAVRSRLANRSATRPNPLQPQPRRRPPPPLRGPFRSRTCPPNREA